MAGIFLSSRVSASCSIGDAGTMVGAGVRCSVIGASSWCPPSIGAAGVRNEGRPRHTGAPSVAASEQSRLQLLLRSVAEPLHHERNREPPSRLGADRLT